MKFSFQFSNMLGAVYRKGDVLFTEDGNSIISPVGNRISVYDLKNNKTSTLPVESRYNYEALALSPTGNALVAVNEDGEAHLISMICKRVTHKYRFNTTVRCVKFSPDGNYFAVCKLNKVFVFKAPGNSSGESAQFTMEKVFTDFCDDTTCLDWTDDSRILAAGSKDGTTKIYATLPLDNFRRCILGSHSDSLVGVFFEKDSLHINTIARNGHLCVWEATLSLDDVSNSTYKQPKRSRSYEDESDCEDDVDRSKEERHPADVNDRFKADKPVKNEPMEKNNYRRISKHYLNDANKSSDPNCNLTAAAYHKQTRILITGFSNGAFFIHELPDVTLIYSLSVSENAISSIAVNETGEWIALGCKGRGQLLVWEWQSESYVLKQQAHDSSISCLAYSSEGLYIATGGEDGKVKLWNTESGYCFVTFGEHTSSITSIKFGSSKKMFVSSSLDGTVRAFDIVRYRNFRTFTSPRPVQFSCVAMDSTCEFVAAGAQDVFEIYLWSVKIGHLLETLSGHEAPVVSLAFSPVASSTALASVSWDKTLRLWNAVETGCDHETIQLTAEGMCVVYKPDGKDVAVSTLDGQISFFDSSRAEQVHVIEGRNDLGAGRSDHDLITFKKNVQARSFASICYSADGECVIAGGHSKNVCIYHVASGIILKRFQITQNRSLDAVDDFINRRKMTEFGNMALVELRPESEGGNVAIRLPGVQKGDMSSRSMKPEVKVFAVAFSPTGLSWSAATTEGVLVYSLNSNLVFDPYELDTTITPSTIKETLRHDQYSKALMMALKLNEIPLLSKVIEKVPPSQIELVVQSLPKIYADKTLKYVALALESTLHVEFYLIWLRNLLTAVSFDYPAPSTLLALQRNLTTIHSQLSKLCNYNKYTATFFSKIPRVKCSSFEDTDATEIKGEIIRDDSTMADDG